jgi:hypothetical protein
MLLMTERQFREALVRHRLSMSGVYSADRDLKARMQGDLPGELTVRDWIETNAVKT